MTSQKKACVNKRACFFPGAHLCNGISAVNSVDKGRVLRSGTNDIDDAVSIEY